MKNKIFKKLNSLTLISLLFTSPLALIAGEEAGKKVVVEEEASSPWFSFSLAYDSQYMFRGVNIVPDSGLISEALEFTAYGFKAGAWYAEGTNKSYNELDAYICYSHAFGPVSLELGYIYYLFPDWDDADTHEVFGGATYTINDYLNTSLYYYHDLDLFDGGYLEWKVTGNVPVYKEMVSLQPYVSVSAGDYNTGEDWELNNLQGGVALVVKATDNITISGYGAYSRALEAIEDNFAGTDTDEFWGGARVTFSF